MSKWRFLGNASKPKHDLYCSTTGNPICWWLIGAGIFSVCYLEDQVQLTVVDKYDSPI